MIQFNFYHALIGGKTKAICQLAEKAYLNDLKLVITSEDISVIEEVDKSLWTYSRKLFLPHATFNDPFPNLQPIYISNIIENPNNSTMLLLIEPKTIDKNILNFDFEKIFIIHENEKLILPHLNLIPKFLDKQNFTVSLFKQQFDNSWVNQAITNFTN